MSGSEAEERIRGKTEAMLREVFPAARIIHELVLEQGGVRIDLAAVTPDRLICAEVKSERDVLTRLPKQIAAMRAVSDAWIVVCADRHIDEVRKATSWLNSTSESALDADTHLLRQSLFREAHAGICNAPARLEMLWAAELQAIRCPRRAANRKLCITAAVDALTGAEVRRAVCRALRYRVFPRADPADV